jgi:hypothetical protein
MRPTTEAIQKAGSVIVWTTHKHRTTWHNTDFSFDLEPSLQLRCCEPILAILAILTSGTACLSLMSSPSVQTRRFSRKVPVPVTVSLAISFYYVKEPYRFVCSHDQDYEYAIIFSVLYMDTVRLTTTTPTCGAPDFRWGTGENATDGFGISQSYRYARKKCTPLVQYRQIFGEMSRLFSSEGPLLFSKSG